MRCEIQGDVTTVASDYPRAERLRAAYVTCSSDIDPLRRARLRCGDALLLESDTTVKYHCEMELITLGRADRPRMLLQNVVIALHFGVYTFKLPWRLSRQQPFICGTWWRELPLRQAISPRLRVWLLTLSQHEQWGASYG